MLFACVPLNKPHRRQLWSCGKCVFSPFKQIASLCFHYLCRAGDSLPVFVKKKKFPKMFSTVYAYRGNVITFK